VSHRVDVPRLRAGGSAGEDRGPGKPWVLVPPDVVAVAERDTCAWCGIPMPPRVRRHGRPRETCGAPCQRLWGAARLLVAAGATVTRPASGAPCGE